MDFCNDPWPPTSATLRCSIKNNNLSWWYKLPSELPKEQLDFSLPPPKHDFDGQGRSGPYGKILFTGENPRIRKTTKKGVFQS